MEKPILNQIVDTYVPIRKDISPDSYLNTLRHKVIPQIKKLTKDGRIIWYSFLIHKWRHLDDKERTPPEDPSDCSYIHLRFGLPVEANITTFIRDLPKHFQQPIQRPVSEMSGIDENLLIEGDWAHAWWILGEASDFVVKIIEGHDAKKSIPIEQFIQFMHFITNALKLGNKCLCIPAGFLQF